MSSAPVTGAVDIGGTKIAVGAIDARGKILASETMPTAAHAGFDAAMSRIAAALDRARDTAGVQLGGIGIGCTGPVDPISGEIDAVDFLPEWKGCNPVAALTEQFGVSVAMENDADAAVLAEAQWGAARGHKNVIFVTVGTGIGGGILLNGALYRGVGGVHPEIGHHVIDDSGPDCFCGAKGCWEVLARGPAVAERVTRELAAAGLLEAPLTAHDVCERARRGDEVALREIAREGRYLGIGIANLITLYAPELIVLGGSVMDSADLFLPAIRAVIARNCGLVPVEKIQVVPATLGRDAALIGASVVWRHRYGRMEDGRMEAQC